MKKFLITAILTVLALSVSGCGCSPDNVKDKTETTAVVTEAETSEVQEFSTEEQIENESETEEVDSETEIQKETNETKQVATKQNAEKEGYDDGKAQITEYDAINLAAEKYGLQGQEEKMYISSMSYIRNMPYYAVNVTGVSGVDEDVTHIFVDYDGSSVYEGYVESDGSAVILG